MVREHKLKYLKITSKTPNVLGKTRLDRVFFAATAFMLASCTVYPPNVTLISAEFPNRNAATSYGDIRSMIMAAGYSPTRSSIENGMRVSSTYPGVLKGPSYEEDPLAPNGHFVMMFGNGSKSVKVDVRSEGVNSLGTISFQEPNFTGPKAETSSEMNNKILIILNQLSKEANIKIRYNYSHLSMRLR